MNWRDDPAKDAEDLLEIACGSGLTTPGRWNAWIKRARILPARLKVWLIGKIRERISDQAADYLAGYLIFRRDRDE